MNKSFIISKLVYAIFQDVNIHVPKEEMNWSRHIRGL